MYSVQAFWETSDIISFIKSCNKPMSRYYYSPPLTSEETGSETL